MALVKKKEKKISNSRLRLGLFVLGRSFVFIAEMVNQKKNERISFPSHKERNYFTREDRLQLC